jgi:Domain of unknown function (DUF4148)
MNTAKFSLFVAAAALLAALSAQTALAQGKSRAQVQQELVQARHDGVIPVSKTSYPPTDEQIARNKQLHAIARHPGEASPNMDQHDSVASR